LAAAKVGDKLGLGRLAFWVAVVLRVVRGLGEFMSASVSSSNGSRSVSAIGGVATALGNDVCAAITDGLTASSNDAALSDVEVMKDIVVPLLLAIGSSSETSGVGNNPVMEDSFWSGSSILSLLLCANGVKRRSDWELD